MKASRRGRKRVKIGSRLAVVAVLLCLSISSHAAVIYNNWTSNNSQSGSYVITVAHNVSTSTWDFVFTVDPWDAEGLGLFVDLGNYDLSATPVLSNVSWDPPGAAGRVRLVRTDTQNNACGSGCNINNLNPPLANPDDEWEMVFRLGRRRYDGIRTFNFSVNDSALAGITESDWGVMAVRARQLCPAGSTLPDDRSDCRRNDKSYATGTITDPQIPLPGTPWLLGFGLLLLARVRRMNRE